MAHALRLPRPLGGIGLIGSSAKWTSFQAMLAANGHAPEAIARITCPIGQPGITGKEPAVIAVAVAAALLQTLPLASQRDAGAAWTEERGTSDEGRRRLKGGPEASETAERAK